MDRVVLAEQPIVEMTREERARVLRERIDEVFALVDPADALPRLEARLAAAPPERAAEEQLLLGIAQRRAKLFLPALLSFDEAEYAAERADDTLLLMHVSQQLGITSGMTGDRHRARAALLRTDAAAARLGDVRARVVALSNLGYLHGEQDQPIPYREHTERALGFAREVGHPRLIASCLCNLAGALTRLHLFDEARAAYDEGESLAELAGWEIGKARFVSGRATLLCEEGALDEGDLVYDQSIELFRQLGDFYQIARTSGLRGGFHLDAGRPASALRHYDIALELAKTWAFEGVPADLLERRAAAMEQVGDLAGALESLRALAVLRKRSEDDRASQREDVDKARAIAMKARWQAEDERRRSRELQRTNELLRAALAREEALRAEVERLARTDSLTGLANRRFTQELLDREIARARRTGSPLCVALLDVDHFKAINDTHGHAAGDLALEEIGRRLQGTVRASDIVGRWGGEEFLVVFTDSTPEVGLAAAERLRSVVAAEPVRVAPGVGVRVTLSAGIVGRLQDEPLEGDLVAAADRALYAAKARGRNCVVEGSGT